MQKDAGVSVLFDNEELALIEGLFQEQSVTSLSLLGYSLRFSYARDRWYKVRGGRIALIMSHHENVWERRMVKGFIASVTSVFSPEGAPEFDVYSCQYSSESLQTILSERVADRIDDYAAVVTVGPWVSKLVRKHMRQKRWNVQQIFMGVRDPVANGLIPSLEKPGHLIGGVYEHEPEVAYQCKSIKTIFPGCKTVVIPYDPDFVGPVEMNDRKKLAAELESMGCTVRSVALSLKDPEFEEKLEKECAGADVLWSVSDPALQLHVRKAVLVAERTNVLFCANELASVFQGAQCGWSDSGSLTGAYTGHLFFALAQSGRQTPLIPPVCALDKRKYAMRISPLFIEKIKKNGDPRFDLDIAWCMSDVIPLGWE
jgi:ABC-type uncharacterized transport system substrate-binding protein